MPLCWKDSADRVLAAYARVRALEVPSDGARDAVWAAWAAAVLDVDLARYRHIRGCRALAWVHPDRWRTRTTNLQRPEQVEVHFALSLLHGRMQLALQMLRACHLREDSRPIVGDNDRESWVAWAPRGTGRAARGAYGRWRRAQREWADAELTVVNNQIDDDGGRYISQLESRRFRRRVLAGFLNGMVWGVDDDPPPCPEDRRERAQVEQVRQQQEAAQRRAAAAAFAAAAAQAASAAERAAAFARAAQCAARARERLAEVVEGMWFRWREAQGGCGPP